MQIAKIVLVLLLLKQESELQQRAEIIFNFKKCNEIHLRSMELLPSLLLLL